MHWTGTQPIATSNDAITVIFKLSTHRQRGGELSFIIYCIEWCSNHRSYEYKFKKMGGVQRHATGYSYHS